GQEIRASPSDNEHATFFTPPASAMPAYSRQTIQTEDPITDLPIPIPGETGQAAKSRHHLNRQEEEHADHKK
ncbi:MAG TPA: hypothetical protein PKH40_12355, partial [Treponemataceae bacterium]|nr:hypothetical protein [Treponemataceae bacterium]